MSQTFLELIRANEALKEASITNAKLALEEAFKPHLAAMLNQKLQEAFEPPYRLTVGRNAITDVDLDRVFRCKHGNVVLESDDCPQCARESIF